MILRKKSPWLLHKARGEKILRAVGDGVASAAEVSMNDVQLVGIVKPVLPVHIYNVCLGRGSLPAFVLDIRADAEFKALHLVNSVKCPVDSPAVQTDFRAFVPSVPSAFPSALESVETENVSGDLGGSKVLLN